jgi:hypothetical protein
VSRKNARSRAALDRSFATLAWREGEEFTTRTRATGQWITVRAEPQPVPTERDGAQADAGRNRS